MIRLSTEEDLNDIMDIFEDARQFMRDNGNPNQWGNGYPQRDIILDDIKSGISYVAINQQNDIIGTMMFQIGNDPTYKRIDGQWLNQEPYAVIHRIATKTNQRGVATQMVNWAYEKFKNIKIDTHHDNKPMIQFLLKNNFHQCGTIYLLNGDPRLAFQKIKHRHKES